MYPGLFYFPAIKMCMYMYMHIHVHVHVHVRTYKRKRPGTHYIHILHWMVGKSKEQWRKWNIHYVDVIYPICKQLKIRILTYSVEVLPGPLCAIHLFVEFLSHYVLCVRIVQMSQVHCIPHTNRCYSTYMYTIEENCTWDRVHKVKETIPGNEKYTRIEYMQFTCPN